MTEIYKDESKTWAERYYVAGKAWSEAAHNAQLLEDRKSVLLAQKKLALGEDIADNKAEKMVKATQEWDDYVIACADAKLAANLARVEFDSVDIAFKDHQNKEANNRAEMRIMGSQA